MKTLLTYAIAAAFSLSLATVSFARPVMAEKGVICCGDKPGQKMTKKECKEKCKGHKGCCHKEGATSRK